MHSAKRGRLPAFAMCFIAGLAQAAPEWLPVEGTADGRAVSNAKSYLRSDVKSTGDGVVEAFELQDMKVAVTDPELKITYRSLVARHTIKCVGATLATSAAEYFSGNMGKGDLRHSVSRPVNTLKFGGAIAGSSREFMIRKACALAR